MTQELLGRVHRELLDVLNSINQDKIHHDGDDFHELLNDVEKALAQPEQCNYPDCKCPTENPCLKGLAQPEQEPVAMVESVATVVSESGNKEVTMSWWHEPALPVGTKLYTHPSQNVIDKSAAKRIATTLGWEPKRGWVDVPDEEIKILWIQYRAAMPRYLCFAKALLARSKEKNNA